MATGLGRTKHLRLSVIDMAICERHAMPWDVPPPLHHTNVAPANTLVRWLAMHMQKELPRLTRSEVSHFLLQAADGHH